MWAFSSKHTKCTWGTLSIFDELDGDSGLVVTADHDAWRLVTGVDGEVARIRHVHFPGRVTMNLSQHTPTNRNLLARLITDAQTGLIVAPLFVMDIQAGVGFSSPLTYLIGLPQFSWSNATQVASWALQCPTLIPVAVAGQSTGVVR